MTDQLDLRKTYRAILDAARNKRFISYGDLAKASDAKWQKVRYKMNHHLGDLVKIAADHEWPIPTSIVVNQNNISDGALEGTARKGFLKAAEDFGYKFTSPETFIREQQQDMFVWAETAPDELKFIEKKKPKIKNNGASEFVQFFGPLLDALRSLGGSGAPRQVYEKIAGDLLIANDDLIATTQGGFPKYENQVRWARFYLAEAGFIDSRKRGVWRLTPEGRETYLDFSAAKNLFRDIRSRRKYTSNEEFDSPPPESEISDLFDDEKKRFWFVGSIWGDSGDQVERFCNEGIWQHDHDDKFTKHVARMQVGDRIAIKASFVKKYGVPFDNQDKPVSCMRIKAVGEITGVKVDDKTVYVNWQPLNEPRDWYFYTYRVTVVEADAFDEFARRLILFTFGGHRQDYEFWLRQPYWAKRYRSPAPTLTETELEKEEDDANFEEAEIIPYRIDEIIDDGSFLPQEELNSVLSSLKRKKNLILQGPPGTGKTWLAKRLGYVLLGTKNRAITRKRMRSIQFHPSLSYEDFVRGWRPDGNGQLSLVDGLFMESVEAARAEPDWSFIVIIEEINRGNPAQIFGELLTLLETDKRREEEAIELAYHYDRGERVFIPRNLYLVGTMNIADRSIALVDLALRRRFAFVTLQPNLNESWCKWCIEHAGIDEKVLLDIRRRMNELNDEIAADRSLGTQFRIGHSYVTPKPDETINDPKAWFCEIVETEIEPLLEEYWFDNPDKVANSKVRLLQGL